MKLSEGLCLRIFSGVTLGLMKTPHSAHEEIAYGALVQLAWYAWR